ncbi:MAG: HEAT repeat domain-containing protein [Candidatus Hydrogenedentes bacterium]|nr:HEAT repeat domain-containing protein [Candidatus Hydrogenedentota bacterium]
MTRQQLFGFAAAIVISAAVMAQAPVTGGKGASLADIAGTDTLVTVQLKIGAEDANVKVDSVANGLLTVVNSRGEKNYYKLSDVKEIRVQGEVVRVRTISSRVDRGLTDKQQGTLDRAITRATELFTNSAANQPIRVKSAQVLAMAGSEDAKKTAIEYLTSLETGNDLYTSLIASGNLYIAGDADVPKESIKQGLASGDRNIRGLAATLAGLTKDEDSIPDLRRMLQDRAPEISAPAARALAKLGDRESIPTLLTMIMERSEERSTAAASALVKLGGPEIAEQMKLKLPKAEGLAKFRVVSVLFEMNDPEGLQLMRDEMMKVPSLQYSASLVLAPKGEMKALQYLRNYLNQRYDPTPEFIARRALATAALIRAGDRTNAGVFQELLDIETPAVQITVLRVLGTLNVKTLLPILAPCLESPDPSVSAIACQSAVALAYSDYRDRLGELPL